jgi:SRSO17 transposase
MGMDTERGIRFEAYIDRLAEAVGHADRREPMRAYCEGLVLPGDRKSVEPMAARVDPLHVRSRHQSMHHFVADSPWRDEDVLRVARGWALDAMEALGDLEAWIVDDTGFPKKGSHSVGVAHQYCGALGKTANSQCAVSVSLANRLASVPAAIRLYLPESWASDMERREKVGVPEPVVFKTKWQIAVDLIDHLAEEGVPKATVLADAGYGDATKFREALTARGFRYAVGICSQVTVWTPGTGPQAPEPKPGKRGHPAKRLIRDADHQPQSVLEAAKSLRPDAWSRVAWAEGVRGKLCSRFAAIRVRVASRDYKRVAPRDEEWLLVEWPEGEPEPTKYWLSTEPEEITLKILVAKAKLRWRVERDYQELKDEIGLDHYEGRGWRGFHHHASLCIATYAFIMAERTRLSPPSASALLGFTQPAVSVVPRGRPSASKGGEA